MARKSTGPRAHWGSERVFSQIESDRLCITDFALHSIGVILTRLGQLDALGQFVQDLFVDGGVIVIHLGPQDLTELINVARRFSLDFDDAYQYLGAHKLNLTLVSFDTDFDRTEIERKTPAQVLQ